MASLRGGFSILKTRGHKLLVTFQLMLCVQYSINIHPVVGLLLDPLESETIYSSFETEARTLRTPPLKFTQIRGVCVIITISRAIWLSM